MRSSDMTTSAQAAGMQIANSGKPDGSIGGTGLSFEDLRAGSTGRVRVEIVSDAPLCAAAPNEGCGNEPANSSC